MTQLYRTVALAQRLTERAHRIRLSRMGVVPRVIVVVELALTSLLAVMVLGGWRGPQGVSPFDGKPYWQLLLPLTLAALGVISVAVSIAAVRSAPLSRLLLSAVPVVLALVAMDSLPLGPPRGWLMALGVAGVAFGLVKLKSSPGFTIAQSAIAFLPFAASAAAAATGTAVEQALAAIGTASLAPSAGIGLATLAMFALAASLQAHHEHANSAMRWRVTVPAVVVALVIKVVLLAALYLHLTGGVLGGPNLWRPRVDQPLSWVHAFVVAILIVCVAVRSWDRPLVAHNFSLRLTAITVGAAVMELTALVTLITIRVVSSLSPTTDTTPFFTVLAWVIEHNEGLQLGVGIGILAIAVAESAIRRPWTTGSYLWLVAGLWLVPPLTGIALFADSTLTFWATPGQVDTALAVIVAGLLVVKGTSIGHPRILLRLILIPSVVIHAVNLFPESWTKQFLPLAVVSSVVIALAVKAPRTSADLRRNERTLCLLVAAHLGLLAAYLFVLPNAELSEGLSIATTAAWLWLSIPVTAVLLTRVAPSPIPPAPSLWRRRAQLLVSRFGQ